jgi:hypothetical protein
MSDTTKTKTAAVAAQIAGRAATIGAHGVPVGPLVEVVVNELLDELLDIQNEQLAILRNIERDVSQLVEGPYRTAREMLERAMIPGRPLDAVMADLQRASDEFLRAAAQYRDETQSQASAYMQASLVLGLLGDLPAMRHYGDKAWKAGTAALYREASETTSLLDRSSRKRAKRLAGFWSLVGTRKYVDHFQRLKWGVPGPSLAETYPEARAIEQMRESGRQVDVYRDVAANLVGGPDVLPHYWVVAELTDIKMVPPRTRVDRVYRPEQIESRRGEFTSIMRKIGINDHLYGTWYPSYPSDDGFLVAVHFENFSDELLFDRDPQGLFHYKDPQVDRFSDEVNKMFPYELPVVRPWNDSGPPSPLLV